MTKKEVRGANLDNSLRPAIAEAERFIAFLAERVGVDLTQDLIITVNSSHPTALGYFSPKSLPHYYEDERMERLHSINLSTLYLKREPVSIYVTLAHEFAHYYNQIMGISDCSSNQYHNKRFKSAAEMLLLDVERSQRGYAVTSSTPEFEEMLAEFKPDASAFTLCERVGPRSKVGSRMKLFSCDCTKVRCAVELTAHCDICGAQFTRR